MSPDMRMLLVDDAPLDVMFEQHELTRHGISFASQIDLHVPPPPFCETVFTQLRAIADH
jgi:hypothetical protein